MTNIRERLAYDAETGVFTWLKPTATRSVGAIAGSIDMEGYRRISVAGKFFKAHRLAWFFVHGVMPTGEIDHINGTRDDNRISNLRLADRTVNTQNAGLRRDNRSGFAGVCRAGNRWKAQIKIKGKSIQLGTYPSPELAAEAYQQAKRLHHPGYAR